MGYRRQRSATVSAPSLMGSDQGMPAAPLPAGGRLARAFTPLALSSVLVLAGAGSALATGRGADWATQGVLWLVAGMAAGISLSGSA